MYRLNLDPIAEEQIKAVPEGALRPLAELFTLLETAPWSGQPHVLRVEWPELILRDKPRPLTATLTATSATTDSRRRTPATVHLGLEPLSRAVVNPEKRKVGGSTPPLPTSLAC